MKKVIERIVEGPGAPNENDLWLNGKTLKKFQNGEWVAISDGSGSKPLEQIQADWSQADGSKVDYIKNKPSIPSIMNIEAVLSDSAIYPKDQTLTWQSVADFMLAGGIVQFKLYEDDVFWGVELAHLMGSDTIGSMSGSWNNSQY